MREHMGKTWVWWAGLPVLAVLLPVVRLEAVPALRLLLWEALVVLGYAASVWDLREKRIPNGLIGLMAAAWVLIVTPFLFLQTDQGAACALDGALGFLLGGGLFLAVYLISRRGLGGGDVKFMAVSGLFLGLNGVLPAVLCGSILASLTGGALILGKRIHRKDSIPLVPFLYAGILLTAFFQ